MTYRVWPSLYPGAKSKRFVVPEHHSSNDNVRVHWTEMANDPGAYLEEASLPDGVVLRDPSKLRQEDVNQLWDLWISRQEAGEIGLEFSSCHQRDKRGSMEWSDDIDLNSQQKGTKGRMADGFDKASSQNNEDSDNEEEEEEDTKSDAQEEDGPTDEYGWDNEDDEGEDAEISRQGQGQQLEVDADAPAMAGATKEERIAFLLKLSTRREYQQKVNWLQSHVVSA